MKNSLLIILILWQVISACTPPKENAPTAVKTGVIDSVYSDILKEQRKLWVYVPSGGDASAPKHYPVLYLLDGDSHFLAVTAMLQQLSGNSVCPEMIVVAIPNTNRSRDLTPTHSLLMTDGKPQDFLKSTGGGEAFTSFLEKELIPYIESHYPTAPHRMLVGHSFGGLFAINALINHPQIFDSYVAIDPSLWWDKRYLLNHADTVLRQSKFAKKTLYLSVANTIGTGLDTAKIMRDTTGDSFHIRSILHFAKLAKSNGTNGLRFGWNYYPDDSHGSVPLISEYDALRFIFDYYNPSIEWETATASSLKEHFATVSDKIGYPMLPPESLINEAGYVFLQREKLDKAFTFFDLNIKNYPQSANAFDSMGDYYVAKGDTTKAIETFTKALSIKELEYTRKKLNDLKKSS